MSHPQIAPSILAAGLLKLYEQAQAAEHGGDELFGPGIYVDLPAWGFHYLEWL
jgi:hypothetical protein